MRLHEDEIHKRIGFRHITGIKEWRLLERARYLSSVWENNYEGLAVDEAARTLAKNVGSTRDYIKRVLLAYELYKILEDSNFYKIKDLDDDSSFYSTFFISKVILLSSRENSRVESFLTGDMPIMEYAFSSVPIWIRCASGSNFHFEPFVILRII